jgi:hypothetical protein
VYASREVAKENATVPPNEAAAQANKPRHYQAFVSFRGKKQSTSPSDQPSNRKVVFVSPIELIT